MTSVVCSLQILFALYLYQLIEPFVARSAISILPKMGRSCFWSCPAERCNIKKGKERWKRSQIMICTELMILTHVGPFFLPVRHNTQPIEDERLRGEGSERRGYYADALIPSQNFFNIDLILSM